MNLVWVFIIIIAIGFLGSRFVFSKESLPPAIRDIFLTGWEFFLVGAMLGQAGFGVIDQDHLAQLDPFIAFGLAWAGLIFGSQLRSADLVKIHPAMVYVTTLQVIAVGAGVFILFAILIKIFYSLPVQELFMASAVLGTAVAISSPTAISLMSARFPRSKSAAKRALMIIATLDVGPALLTAGLLFSFFLAEQGNLFSLDSGVARITYSLVISAALAGLYLLFDRKGISNEENLALFVGYLVFISGIAFYLSLSPLFLSLLTGIFLANTLAPDDKIYSLLHATEKPFYVILLIVSGLWWNPESVGIWVIAPLVVIARLLLKKESVDLFSSWFLKDEPLPKGVGLGLCGQGALALAIGLNYLLTYPGQGPNIVFSVIVITTLINEAMAPALLGKAIGVSTEEPEAEEN